MTQAINFNSGPAALPVEVRNQFMEAVQCYQNTGMSILELHHRSKAFAEILEESKAILTQTFSLHHHELLWLHGGARLQFAMLAANFLSSSAHPAAYINSGYWANEAAEAAKYYGTVNIIASSAHINHTELPQLPATIDPNHAYLHYTTNNTLYGTQWRQTISTTLPLIADMSSDIFSRQTNYAPYSLFYATAHKQLGIPGISLVVIEKDFLRHAATALPSILSYKAHVAAGGNLTTANVPAIYIALLMLRHISQKGMANIEQANEAKANLLYTTLDNCQNYIPTVTNPAHRSTMNVCFRAVNAHYEQKLLDACRQHNIHGIEGHRLTGGFRLALYNSIPIEWVKTFCDILTHCNQ